MPGKAVSDAFARETPVGKRTVYYGRTGPGAPHRGGRLPVALAFPGSARAALSALGWQAVYRLGCDSALLAMERFFLSPGKTAPLSEDSSFPLGEFPVTAISLGYELDGLPLVQALESAGIPLLAEKRPAYPLVLGGGPLAFINPALLSPFLDAWFVGEAEAGLAQALEEMARMVLGGTDKQTLLDEMAGWPGFLVPGRSRTPVKRVLVADGRRLAAPAASCFVSPEAEFKDTLLLEINRGCPHACRFCAAGYVYRPPRQADVEELKAVVAETGPRKVGLVGTALTDWPDLNAFLRHLSAAKVKFTLSSVRAAGVTPELLHILRDAGLRTLTLALEGPSQRLRDMANKHLREEEFLRAVELAASRGVNHLKVYVIVGWPGETQADYDEMGRFLAEICKAGRVGSGKRGIGHLTLGTNPLIPKPFTPLQWAPMASRNHLEDLLHGLKAMAKPLRGVRVEGEQAGPARLQGLLARGDESLAELVMLAARLGSWRKAQDAWTGDAAWFLDRERDHDEVFPWECVDVGVDRQTLWREWELYNAGRQTPGCPPTPCGRCRACAMAAPTPEGEVRGNDAQQSFEG